VAGRRRIDGLSEKARAQLRRHALGFVFQAFHLMDELTAVENVELPALLAGRTSHASRVRAQELLEQVGLRGRAAICRPPCRVVSVSVSRLRVR